VGQGRNSRTTAETLPLLEGADLIVKMETGLSLAAADIENCRPETRVPNPTLRDLNSPIASTETGVQAPVSHKTARADAFMRGFTNSPWTRQRPSTLRIWVSKQSRKLLSLTAMQTSKDPLTFLADTALGWQDPYETLSLRSGVDR
jgi:hypothetical protein